MSGSCHGHRFAAPSGVNLAFLDFRASREISLRVCERAGE